jgi:hypothetical protein
LPRAWAIGRDPSFQDAISHGEGRGSMTPDLREISRLIKPAGQIYLSRR